MKTNTSNLPKQAQQRGLFCLWKYEEVNGRTTKVPYNPNSPQYRAKSNDRSTFAPMATAQAAAAGFDGMGIGIFDDITAIDIDHCIDDAGQLCGWRDCRTGAEKLARTRDGRLVAGPGGLRCSPMPTADADGLHETAYPRAL